MEILPITWARKDRDFGSEDIYAKIADDLIEIATKWGAEVQGESDKWAFQSKRFGMRLEITIYTKKSPDNQTVFLIKGSTSGGHQNITDPDIIIGLKPRVAQVSTPGGLIYPVQKDEGALIIDKKLSVGDVIQIISLIDNKAKEKGLIGKGGERISHPETIKLKKDKYKVSEVFKGEGTLLPVMPWESVYEKIREFDRPNELTTREDPWNTGMVGVVKKKDADYFTERDKILNNILIERKLTIPDLLAGLQRDEQTFMPLLLSVREEITKRMANRKKH